MRIIFMGSPEFAVPTLNALVAAGHEVVAVYTQPPRPAGRGKADRPTAVETRARALGIEVRSPRSLKGVEEQDAFAALGADLAVVAAYGLILPQPILDAPPLGCINVHASLLPRWRGAAPIQRAIMAGDLETGITIMQMDVGLDTGSMLWSWSLRIDKKNAGFLTSELAQQGAFMIRRYLEDPTAYPPTPQPIDGVTYASKIAKSETRIDWDRPAWDIECQVRAFNPLPGAWFEVAGERVKLLSAEVVDAGGAAGEVLDGALTIACGEGSIRPTLLQRAGRSPMAVGGFLRGFAIPVGTRLA